MTANKPIIPAVSTGLVGKLPLGLSAVLTLAILGSLLWLSRYGIDFTDESFYLVWMANPFNYPFSRTQFGFLYHPLYVLLGGDIAALRQANVIIIFGLAWLVCHLFLKRLVRQSAEFDYVWPIMSAAIATSALVALVFAGMWLSTPGYNTLAFKGLLVIMIGLLLADKSASRTSDFGWILIGIGGWLAFMAKPTTAAAAGFGVALYLLITGKFTLRLLLAPLTFLVLLLLSALIIDGSVPAFIDRYKGTSHLVSLRDSGHSMDQVFRVDSFQFQPGTTAVFWGVVLIASAGFTLSLLTIARSGLVVSMMQVLMIVLGSASFFVVSSQLALSDAYQNLLLGTVLFAAVPVGIVTLINSKPKSVRTMPVPQWPWILPLIVFPYAYAFGTGNNYWLLISSGALFLVLLALVVLSHLADRQEFPRLVLTLAIAVQVVSLGLLLKGVESPYRQPNALYKNDYPIDLGTRGGRLIVSQSFGKYISSARDIASRSGFVGGTPMIDMSGHSPGVLHMLGANSVGLAWTTGGYPGSAQFVEAALKSVPCEQLAEAWLVAEPEGPRAIPDKVLASFGANLPDDFEIVGTMISPDGYAQEILRPTRMKQGAITNCLAKRATP